MDNGKNQRLIFVYNADSGLGNLILDGAHKIISPKTYACSLCDITHGAFFENKVWKTFRKQLVSNGFDLEFLHKDEFVNTYGSKFGYKFSFPIILISKRSDLEVLVSTEELNQTKNAKGLIQLLQKRLDSGII
ncbi:GTPase [Maribacter sp. 2304DJ31-5]|uniref:GTPase n=1 Tax=Maribacter sp. 2304DJ31-5 TaxID=3386273 RepID=UPI0039BC3EA3